MITSEPISSLTARANARATPERPGGRVREDDPSEDGDLGRPERTSRLLHLGVELVEHGLNGAHHEGQRDEEERQDDAVRENAIADP